MFGGGMLTGEKIRQEVKRGKIQISDYDPDCINPNSYNLKLHPQFKIYKRDAVRANIVSGTMPKPIQVGIDHICEIENAREKVSSRLSKQGLPGTSTRNKKKAKQSILHENTGETRRIDSYHNAEIPENDDVKVYIGNTGRGNTELACTDRVDNLVSTVMTSQEVIKNIEANVDKIRKLTKKSAMDMVDAASKDLETLFRNELELEKNINRLSLYPNIESAVLPPLDMREDNETIEFEIPEEGFVLQPGVLYIARTVERTWTDKYIPMINGRSSGGRLGISIHICAGFGDIGFDGTWTLEITCVEPVRIYPNSEIAQVCFFKPYGKVKDLYRGRYFQQEDATASRFNRQKGDNHND